MIVRGMGPQATTLNEKPLLPCPWCGQTGENLSPTLRLDGMYRITCPCGACGPTSGDSQGAKFQWNTRRKENEQYHQRKRRRD